MSDEMHIMVSKFLRDTLTSRREPAPDALGLGGDGRKASYCVSLEINGKPETYTIEKAETAVQALLKALERLVYYAEEQELRSADVVRIVSVRESA